MNCNLLGKKLSLLVAFLVVFSASNTHAQTANLEVRAEGNGVSVPDTINGLQAMAVAGSSVRLIWSAQSAVRVTGATIGFVLSSPTNPNMKLGWNLSGDYNSALIILDTWDVSVWNLGGPAVFFRADSLVPDSFLAGGVAIASPGGFLSEPLIDVFMADLQLDDTGVLCIDSAFLPPSGTWLMSPNPVTTWGESIGGYPDGGYCITVFPAGCCTTPGDANGDGFANIADVSFLIARIFADGEAPPCANEADANADKNVNVADVPYMIARIFAGGPAPHCWWLE